MEAADLSLRGERGHLSSGSAGHALDSPGRARFARVNPRWGGRPDNGAADSCGFDRWHIVSVKRRNGALYPTSFYACSGCSVMFLNPDQFSALGSAAPNIEMPTIISLAARRK